MGCKEIKYSQDILWLLKAIWVPREVAVVHCQRHQKKKSNVQMGNERADWVAKTASMRPNATLLATIPWETDKNQGTRWNRSNGWNSKKEPRGQTDGIGSWTVVVPAH